MGISCRSEQENAIPSGHDDWGVAGYMALVRPGTILTDSRFRKGNAKVEILLSSSMTYLYI